MKKLMLVVLVLLVPLGFLFAGGQAEGAEEIIELEYLNRNRSEEWGREAYNTVKDMFEKENPGVRIKFLDVPYDDQRTQMLMKAQAGTPPDISEPVHGWIPQLASAGILEPIRNYMSDEDLEHYVQSALEDTRMDGVNYAVPAWHGPIVLFGNTELMEKAGVPLRAPEDIYEFKSWIEKISALGKTDEGQDIIGFSLRNVKTANSAFWFVPWIWAWGGELVDEDGNPALDSEGVINALEFYQWLTNNGHSPKGLDHAATRIAFAQGRAGFVFDGPWLKGMLRTMTDNPDVDDMYKTYIVPKGLKTGEPWSIANPTSLIVFEGSDNKEEAFDFIKFFTQNQEVQGIVYNDMGLLPTNLEFLENDPSMQTEYTQTFLEQMKYSRGNPWKDERWSGLQDILATAMSKAIAGDNPAEVAEEAQQKFKALLQD